ncbi:MAG: T9SS type A sorting domain-containing protein [Bacteroidetes bacterium]|nr:T9SS type A sorting domain-containing protein [Bacteroidota bacterium]
MENLMLRSDSRKVLKGALLLLYLVICLDANSQLFSSVYQKDRPAMVFDNVVTNNDTVYILGLTAKAQPVGFNFRLLLGKVPLYEPDSLNAEVFIDSQPVDYAAWYNSLSRDKISNGYSATGYIYREREGVLLLTLDENFNPTLLKEIFNTDTSLLSYKGMKVLRYDSSTFFISGIIQHANGNSNTLLLKTDISGNLIFQKEFGTGTWYEYASSMAKLKNGRILIGSSKSYENRPYAVSQTWLLEVDTNGVLKRQWFDPNDSTYGAYSLRQTKDGGYVYAAQKAEWQTINNAFCVATIVKMDSAFNKQWTFRGGGVTPETGIFDIEELEEGTFIACGNTSYAHPDSTITSGWIIKLSSTGEMIWQKNYEGFATYGAINYLYDVDVLSDGGFIACGEANGDNGQFGWLLKVDSNGCEVENCGVGIDEVVKPEISGIKVYPNPASTEITLDYTSIDWAQQGELSIVLMNSLGQIIHHEKLPMYSVFQRIDVSKFPVGFYLAHIKRNNTTIATSKFAKQ